MLSKSLKTSLSINDCKNKNYAVVVAHPDDEVLWFSSALEQAKRIIFCYNDHPIQPKTGPARLAVIADYPCSNLISLKIPQSGSFNKANWNNPVMTQFGMDISNKVVRFRYETNFELLVTRLESLLSDVDLVFTHNPWVEYGHEEHVQVHQAVKSVMYRRGSQILVSSYFSAKSSKLMDKTLMQLSTESLKLPVNKSQAFKLSKLYKKHECWTWKNDWEPPDEDLFWMLRDQTAPIPAYENSFLSRLTLTFIPDKEPIPFWRKLLPPRFRPVEAVMEE